MELRSITLGCPLSKRPPTTSLETAGALLHRAKKHYESNGYPVQSVRLATQPVSSILRNGTPQEFHDFAVHVESLLADTGIDYCSLGPIFAAAQNEHAPLIEGIPHVLQDTERIFLSVMAATTRDGLNLRNIRRTAEALLRATGEDSEGTRSRRFAVSANVPANGPFFPSAYHRGRRHGFSIAIEAADLAVEAFSAAVTLDEARKNLRRLLLNSCSKIVALAEDIAQESGMVFRGTDISLAPYPEESRSIAYALERLGVGRYGNAGTLFASAFITDILAEVPIRKCGFSGLMIPLLEDATMAVRQQEGAYTLDSLLLYSAVCGAGLDTIPVPGNITVAQLASVYLDLCTLAVSLDKPLTARLMPLAGKEAGDRVSFAFPYFASTTVVTLAGEGSPDLFERGGWVARMGNRRRRRLWRH